MLKNIDFKKFDNVIKGIEKLAEDSLLLEGTVLEKIKYAAKNTNCKHIVIIAEYIKETEDVCYKFFGVEDGEELPSGRVINLDEYR